ncbi:unnamed protein product [Aphanomyces euteiches]|uniref:Uncharacterized protein n=1 Tax=Aphanomyces euteiches TaxID=100861 RepID=A0A6G0WR58_9STRA|nr:hypothetical protein Ae201684_012548 [Aphanomyces euteiches]KAH9090396.1 hypothetical protein Ae201684P_014199 [Aphanomyces euteiches]KAH9138492.1 hypothetical protein AeRB84_017201 [Aphanomyces euteiches]
MGWYARRLIRKLLLNSSRLLACFAAGCVFYCEMMGSTANKLLLLGTSTPPANTVTYASHLFPLFLPTLVSSTATINKTLQNVMVNQTSTPFVVYLDGDKPTGQQPQQQPTLQSKFCHETTAYDYLYYDAYLDIVLTELFAGFGGWEASKFWVIVDCTYDGRVFSDSTVIKFYLLDKAMTQITTVMLQTLSITRPQMQLISSGGAAMWTKTNLKSMKIGDDGQVTSSESASYSVAIGFTFPYESTNFYPVVLEDSVAPDGQWRAQVVSTREKFLFAGTSGIYRRAPSIQGSFNYFYWELPSDPLEFVAKIQFVGVMVFKDSWGWFRCFLGIGIGSNIAVNFGVSLLVVINMYRENNILWIPDVYPSIQSRAMIRASLLLLDCIMNSWWYPYQWAINQGSKRNHWGGTLDFNESSRADGLMAVLAITYLTAKTLHVRVQLVIVVYIYAMCYYMRQSVIASCGLFLEKVTPFIKKNYFENIFPTGNNAMDLWAYHENRSTNFWLIANECTYLIVATGVSVGYVLLTKLWIGRLRDKITNLIATLHFVRWRHVRPIIQYMVRHRMTNPAAAMAHIAWNRRSTLYHELNEWDVENTNVERCTGSILEHINGFVALTKDYIYEGGRIYVSPSGVWLLGFVIVNDQYVVNINHYIYLLFNSLCGQTYFKVYGFLLKDDLVTQRTYRIVARDIPPRNVWRVSLKRLQ